ncbi:DUF4241 domain-containing protein [Planctomycetes bacterium TBK1r]|uniref:Uncharacterized protein n=1 Tax=Stieleria magnilauensis TaxID=2527963 RepID=A0ABX5XZR8_9BACT|nr:hypothetical protein TBK1r_62210 [Planctomycetes bacterium TBK1r]
MDLSIAKLNRVCLGKFNVRTGVLVAADPCWQIERCDGLLAVPRGMWSAVVETEPGSGILPGVNTLLAYHESYQPSDADQWELTPLQVGVDAGLFGLFDAITYEDGSDGLLHECRDVFGDGIGGVVSSGVVASTGIGDGWFDCSVGRDDEGRIVAVKLHREFEDRRPQAFPL